MPEQLNLLDPPAKPLGHAQAAVHEALRWLIVAGDTTDLQKALGEHGMPMERSNIARRLCELEEMGLVERVGHNYSRRGNPTTWRRSH